MLRPRCAHWLRFVSHEIRGNYGAPVVGLARFRPLWRADKYVEDVARDQEAVEGRADADSGRVEHAWESFHGEAIVSGEKCVRVPACGLPQRRVH